MQALCNALDQHLPSNCSYRHPEGGYFVWIKLPEGMYKISPYFIRIICRLNYVKIDVISCLFLTISGVPIASIILTPAHYQYAIDKFESVQHKISSHISSF